MNLLAVETSGVEASIALATESQVIETYALPVSGRRHAQTLVSSVDQMLDRHSIAASDIDIVAVSVGPGSFTGLRVGVVFAKTFAFANKTSLVAVDTLQAIAQRSTNAAMPVCVISDAQRQEVFLNAYDVSQPIAQPAGETTIVAATEMKAQREGHLWTGPGVLKFADHLDGCEVASEPNRMPSAETVAIVGRSLADKKIFASIGQLEPVYLRRSYAEENADRSKSLSK